jgi:hypothetical protein
MGWTQTERGATTTPYVHQAYPKHVYRGVEYRVVQSEADWAALGPGWGYSTGAPETTGEQAENVAPPKRTRKARA